MPSAKHIELVEAANSAKTESERSVAMTASCASPPSLRQWCRRGTARARAATGEALLGLSTTCRGSRLAGADPSGPRLLSERLAARLRVQGPATDGGGDVIDVVRYLDGARVYVAREVCLLRVQRQIADVARRQLMLVPSFRAATSEEQEAAIRHLSGNLAQAWPTIGSEET